MVNLIGDLRKAWDNPTMAVSIPVSGFDGTTFQPRRSWPSSTCLRVGCILRTECQHAGLRPFHVSASATIVRAGWDQKNSRRLGVINAQFGACNASRHPGMAHCVAEETRSYWRSFQNSPVNQGCERPRSEPFLSRSVSL